MTTRVILVGSGGMAREHLRTMLREGHTTVVGIVEPSEAARAATRTVFAAQDLEPAPFFDTLEDCLRTTTADTALVCTPHRDHLHDTVTCLRAELDVCLEKPMVLNVAEALELISVRDETARLVMVAFPGSLSPAVWTAKRLIADGAIGRVTAVSAFVHQNWKLVTTGTWRQDPAISGGGFLFDTGSHMVNTVVDLLGEDVASVTAILETRGAPVEIASTVSGRTSSGVLFSLTGAGDSIQCTSEITVFGTAGVLRTGIWGERLEIKTIGAREFEPVSYAASSGPWAQFLNVRAGKLENPCPPEIGLRFARLMDLIRDSAESGRAAHAS
jgi:predicted dehydrogenase